MIEIDVKLLVAQGVTFCIAAGIVWRYAWKPILKLMDDRVRSIKADIDAAKRAQESLAKLEDEYKARAEENRSKIDKMFADARSDVMKMREELLKSARAEADNIRARSMQEIVQQREMLVRQLRSTTVDLAMAIAQRAMGEVSTGQWRRERFEQFVGAAEEYIKNNIAS